MAQEILHSIKNRTKGKIGWMSVKLDMAKAFDRVEWIFLNKIMQKVDFPSKFIFLIMTCLSIATFKFNINGHVVGHVIPLRGLRQGDPLSPYLFLLCSEGLSSILKKSELSENAFGLKIARTSPKISHLLFADDNILFYRSNIQACNVIKEPLSKYKNISEQLVNFQISSILFPPI
uniref:Reverse transcriptase domain-containing protein n=1 Tax=Cannabis sativa TaxID=3483 RepID=A0A803Q966_CANSA